MRRVAIEPRSDWKAKLEAVGISYHTLKGAGYPAEWQGREVWNESAYYALSLGEVLELEKATDALHAMCLEMVDRVIAQKLWERVGVDAAYAALIEESWNADHPSVYGRFDLVYGGRESGRAPKLLEYNADTPTSLIEAAVAQWFWYQEVFPKDRFPRHDQFNSIHEKLIDAWGRVLTRCPSEEPLTFTAVGHADEDVATACYLMDTACQAGHATQFVPIEKIGVRQSSGQFVDERGRRIKNVFKLYPYEWMFDEEFGKTMLTAAARWIEPAWKVILSSKGMLAMLSEMFPNSPYLLRATTEEPRWEHVRKPFFSREGANIAVRGGGRGGEGSGGGIGAGDVETPGPYGAPYVYQALAKMPRFDGKWMVVGSWVIDGESAGIGIREDDSAILNNASAFVPHVIEK